MTHKHILKTGYWRRSVEDDWYATVQCDAECRVVRRRRTVDSNRVAFEGYRSSGAGLACSTGGGEQIVNERRAGKHKENILHRVVVITRDKIIGRVVPACRIRDAPVSIVQNGVMRLSPITKRYKVSDRSLRVASKV